MMSAVEGPLSGKVLGVDFSGAKRAGRRIWIATGTLARGTLAVDGCGTAASLPGGGALRGSALTALVHLIRSSNPLAVGMDFPFGLPAPLVTHRTWVEFVLSFGASYPTEMAFKEAMMGASNGSELKRVTDLEARTPFSPYNLRLFRQTFYGIGEVLAPLVRDGSATTIPMQNLKPGKPWILEICPASTLKASGLRFGAYKVRTEEGLAQRRRILDWLSGQRQVTITSGAYGVALADHRGDALDSIIAAEATARAVAARSLWPDMGAYALEGYVFH